MRAQRPLAGAAALLVSTLALGIDLADPDWRWRIPGERPPVSFRMLDADRDGVLSPEEAKRHPVARGFQRFDIDADGRLSPLEFNQAALELAAAPDDTSVVSGTVGMTVVDRDGRVVVGSVGRDSAAAEAGLRPGDVVLGYAGEPVARARDLYRRILDSAPGSVVEVTVERAGKRRQLKLRIDQFDATPRA